MIPEEEIATVSAQQKLADLASSLMSAAAGEGEGNETSNSADNAGAEAMTTNPLVRKARKLLFRRLRVGVEDSRVFIGKFHCLDKQGNIILYDTVEYRQISPPPSTTTTSSSSSSAGSDGQSSSGSAPPAATDSATTEQRSLGLVLIPARCRTSCHVECSLEEQFSLLSI